MRKGTLVTARRWYMARRVYGRVVDASKSRVVVSGNFGTESFSPATIRTVKVKS